jgi:dsDNA-specific endonuclease/ATPase MutS2
MSRFTIALDGAVRSKTKKIVFIHGIGNGKLKYEIRKTLDSKYSRLKYQDASFKEYGYGATMVILK